jgi:hypothetical protein
MFAVRRDREGNLITGRDDIQVPVRAANARVVSVKALRDRFAAVRQAEEPTMVEQNGSANFAVAVLNRPWRQRFQGGGGPRAGFQGRGSFVASIMVAPQVTRQELQALVREVLQ